MKPVQLAAVLSAILVVGSGAAYIAHLHSRIGELEQRLASITHGSPGRAASQSGSVERPAARDPSKSSAPRTLTPEQREAMIRALGGPNSSLANPVWFATVPNDPETANFQNQIQSAFEEAGWIVKGNARVRFRMKPGVYIFAADEDPPAYVAMAQQALEAAGIEVTSSGRGYREFYKAKKAENPNWIGFEMSDDQTYVIAVGRKPEPTSDDPPAP